MKLRWLSSGDQNLDKWQLYDGTKISFNHAGLGLKMV